MAVPTKINPTGRYRVKLMRPVELAPDLWARPEDDVIVTGDALQAIRDKVETAEPIA